jgi:hypothetical protein
VNMSNRSRARVTLTRISSRAASTSKSGGGGVARSGRTVSNRTKAVSGNARSQSAKVAGTSVLSTTGMDTFTTVSADPPRPRRGTRDDPPMRWKRPDSRCHGTLSGPA